jgi:phosphonopyruvate decarboxylase
MHMGSLSTLSLQAPTNLVHVVFNNKSHESVGSEPTVLGDSNLAELALILGYRTAKQVNSSRDLQKLLGDLSEVPGPHFIELETRTGIPKNLPRPNESLPELLSGFRAAVESDTKV